MSTQSIIIVCGNQQCQKRLQINEPEKFKKGAKCPSCGYINPLPAAASQQAQQERPTVPSMLDDVPTGFQARPQPVPKPSVPGWLIVKDELTQAQTFTLHEGSNTVGRQSVQSPADHMIDSGDKHMSRPHCTIDVRLNRLGVYTYTLKDGVTLPNGSRKNSLNGTYLNGKEERLHEQDQIYLNDGDTIQIGITKLVLKTGYSATSQQQANQNVEEMDYERTVINFLNR